MKTHHTRNLLATAILLGATLNTTAPAADFTATWNGTTGNWNDATKWSTNPTFPNNGVNTFDAIQNAGTLTVNQAITIQKLTMGGGTLTGSQTLTLNEGLILTNGGITASAITASGASTFSAGSISGAGTANFLGGVTFGTTATKSITASRVANIGDGAGINDTSATWSGGSFELNTGGVITNKSDSTFNNTFDGSMNSSFSTNGTFNNQGTFTKSGGTGAGTSFSSTVNFNNTGTVNVNSGTLTLNGSGTSTGAWNVVSGSTLKINANHTFNASSSFSGAGTTEFSGGIITINATTPVNSPFSLTGAGVTGSGTLNVNGAATFSAGSISGAGTANFLGGVTFGTTATKSITSFRVVNIGDGAGINDTSATWSGGSFDLNGGGVITNKSDSTFTNTFDGSMNSSFSTVGTFNNQGTFTKSGGTGAGTSFSSTVNFNNTGTVNVNSGTLTLNGGVTQHSGTTLTGGTWKVTNGSTLNINTGSNLTTIGSAASVTLDGAASTFNRIPTTASTLTTNQGSFTLKNDRDITTASAFSNSGTVSVQDSATTFKIGATGNLAYTQTGPSSVTILAGGAMIDSSAFNLNGGALRGTGTIDGPLTATSGNATTIAPGASAGTLTVNGSAILGVNNTLTMELGGTISGTDYDQLVISGVLTLSGVLGIDLINLFEDSLTMGTQFILATSSSSVLGSFSNVANGGTIMDSGGYHLFSVHYGLGSLFNPNQVVLLAVTPEPGRAVLFLLGLSGLFMRRHRRVPSLTQSRTSTIAAR